MFSVGWKLAETKNLRDFPVIAKLKQPSQSNKTQPNIISHCNDSRCHTCNLLLMVLHLIHFTTLENNVKSHIDCPALQTTSYI